MAGISFDVSKFEQSIQEKGYVVDWEQAFQCQCINNDQAKPACPYCQGSGYRYLPKKRIKALATTLQGNQELNIQGLRQPGTAYLTPQNDTIMGFHDRVTFPEVESKYTQVVTYRDKKTTKFYRPIHRVLFIVHGENVYEIEKDFIISEDRYSLIFSNDEGLKDGDKISVLYMTSPSYLVIDLLHELRSTRVNKGVINPYTQKMPNQYMIKREDFVYGKTINEPKEKGFFDEDWNR